jgi:hypothetical protein
MSKLKNTFLIATTFLLFTTACWPAAAQQPAETSTLVEQGKFTLHKFEQVIGEETYEIRRDGDALAVQMDFRFTDRSTTVPLTAKFRSALDLTPQSFEIKGRTARMISIDETLSIGNSKVQFRSRDQQSELALSEQEKKSWIATPSKA